MSARREKLIEASNRRLVANMYERVLKPLDSARVDEFFARDYVQHNPLAASGRIAEHWDVAQDVPVKAANANGMF